LVAAENFSETQRRGVRGEKRGVIEVWNSNHLRIILFFMRMDSLMSPRKPSAISATQRFDFVIEGILDMSALKA
jgi:hypothetical protein